MGFLIANSNNAAPTKRSEMASTLLEGKIYVAGGINFWGSSHCFEVYDIAQKTWERLAKLPKKLNHVGLAAYKGKIYLSGGFFNARQTKFSNVLYVYDVSSNQWQQLSTMPAERGAHLMIQRGHYLHLIGGRNHTAIWSYDFDSQKWTSEKIAPLPEKRDHISILQTEEKLYVVGGRHRGTVKADCWAYDFGTNEWTTFTKLPTPRGGQSACLFNDQIHIIGGEDLKQGKTYSRHDIFDLNNKTWHQGNDLTIARHGFITELFQNRWLIYGGGKQAGIKTLISTTSNLEILDL